MPAEPCKIFISYSHEDDALCRELVKHLALLRRQGKVETWHDRKIEPGDEWRGQIDDELEAADVILLLVSASFIDSDYCWDVEATRALERHARGEAKVIPIIVRPCHWEDAPFAELQALPSGGKPVKKWADRDEAWEDVVRGLRTAIDALDKAPAPAPREKREPRYADDESRHLSLRLKQLFQRRKELTIAGGDTHELQGEILDVRRLLRKGPQLRAGEFLGDGRYELLEVVGQGGFATVWKAWDEEGGRLVALKVLHGHYAEDRSRRDRFFRGARLMADLAHPRIVRVLESELSDDGWRFFVMEFLPGGSFEQAVLAGGLTLERRLEIVRQVGEALEHAHQRGAVHRDVKPANVLLDAEGQAKLSDFDLVRADDTTGLTATRAMMGTVQFAAPEALESARDVGPAADVYSLGATAVFAVLGGRLPPWFYRDPGRAIDELRSRDELKPVLERAIAFKAGDRFASVADFCRALSSLAPTKPLRVSAIEESGKEPEGEAWVDPVLGMRFRRIEPGTFIMGSPSDEPQRDDDERQHEVTLTRSFWIAETTVTQKEWQELTGNNPSQFQGDGQRPVEQVSWFDAVAFANLLSERTGLPACYELTDGNFRDPGDGFKCKEVRLVEIEPSGYRLPTEAEWEYAARAGTTTPFSTGRSLTTEKANYDGNVSYAGSPQGEYREETVAVRSFDPNPWSLYEVHGNVWEWVWDWFGEFPSGSGRDPAGPERGSYRVVRGGSWLRNARRCRSASRYRFAPGYRVNDLGFRLVRTA